MAVESCSAQPESASPRAAVWQPALQRTRSRDRPPDRCADRPQHGVSLLHSSVPCPRRGCSPPRIRPWRGCRAPGRRGPHPGRAALPPRADLVQGRAPPSRSYRTKYVAGAPCAPPRPAAVSPTSPYSLITLAPRTDDFSASLDGALRRRTARGSRSTGWAQGGRAMGGATAEGGGGPGTAARLRLQLRDLP
jgi:hypothetical protein